jgi:hypothetical protein
LRCSALKIVGEDELAEIFGRQGGGGQAEQGEEAGHGDELSSVLSTIKSYVAVSPAVWGRGVEDD